jgi:hypothetical protein
MTYCLVYHHINDHLVFVLVSKELGCILRLIISPAAKFALLSTFFALKHERCGNPSWIMCGLRPKSNEWRTPKTMCRMFKDQERSSRLYVLSDNLIQSVNPQKKFWKTALHNFRTFVWIFTNFTLCSLRDYRRLGYHMFFARWVPKIVMNVHKTQTMASALSF